MNPILLLAHIFNSLLIFLAGIFYLLLTTILIWLLLLIILIICFFWLTHKKEEARLERVRKRHAHAALQEKCTVTLTRLGSNIKAINKVLGEYLFTAHPVDAGSLERTSSVILAINMPLQLAKELKEELAALDTVIGIELTETRKYQEQ